MDFGPEQYVAVLKVKRGEKRALGLMSPWVQRRMTPLLEIVERRGAGSVGAHLDRAFRNLTDSVHPYTRCFLDVREIAPDGVDVAAEVFHRARVEGVAFTPVTGISRSIDVAAAIEHRDRGIALRVTREEFETGGLTKAIRDFMSQNGLAREETDLIVDLGAVRDLVADGVARLTEMFLASVPDHSLWRTFSVVGCAFPASMGGVDRNSYALVERVEWIGWRDSLYSRRADLTRLPTFGDSGIQHPMGVEGFDPKTMQVSAAIRYTVKDAWLLIKGESTRRNPPSAQFPSLARRLVYGDLRSFFAGAKHCPGCEGIVAAADGATGFGSAEVWRRLGCIHHATTVMQELGSLPWP